jgi:acyl transferase domain-containing protein
LKKEKVVRVEPIAIIGMGCRFPGASDLQAFWQLMCNGVDAITEVPTDRFDVQAFYHPQPATPGKIMSRWGGFLDQIDHFDAAFFGISPREAARMDPQHRLLLEVAWEAMEDAGQIPNKPSNTEAGVFIGIITSDYWDRQFRNPVDLDVYSTAGSARSGAAGRISYALGLQGISVAVDAACSSSLVAVHLACQSLRSGSCNLAIAGGVNIILNPDHTIGYSQGKMMAPDGRCKTFDARANGYVRSEGAGIVVLKPLSLALADNDPLYAIIRGSAANNDGHSDLFMTPSVQGQQAVLRQAYQDAGRSPGHVQYVETHGTGTSVGDPIELKALGSVLAENRPASQPCIIGSVKTNIGHTEGAAGLAGLIKVALCLKHKVIPPHLHFHEPNPAIPWKELPLVVAQELRSWPESDHPRLAGVSSFGIAGTNAHLVVEEAPSPERTAEETCTTDSSAHILTLSAHSTDALKEMARRYQGHISKQEGAMQLFHDMCYTTSIRKTHHDYRLAIVGHSPEEAQSGLEAFLHNETSLDIVAGSTLARRSHKMVWVFPGQGSQWVGMGRDLFLQEPVFREMVERCNQAMRRYIDWSLLEQFQPAIAESHLDHVQVVQPMIFTIQVALAALWRSWGIEPDAVIGHSMGEVAAAYVAGALDLDDACRIICGRSILLQRRSGQGAMAAVELSLEQAKHAIQAYQDRVSIAVSNSPNSTVISGDPATLADILAQMEQRGVFGRLINVTVASHSPQMDILLDDVLALLAPLRPKPSTIPLYSTVTGNICKGEDLNASYWAQNLRAPVLFLNTVQRLLEDTFDVFLEISPHPLLVGSLKQTMHDGEQKETVLASLRREEEGRTVLLRALSVLYTLGYPIIWKRLYTSARRHVDLPTYPWQRERLWNPHLEDATSSLQASREHYSSKDSGHPLLGPGIQSALQPGTYIWEKTLDTTKLPYLSDHCIHGSVVFPSTGYIEIALAAATEVFATEPFSIQDMVFKKALFFPKNRTQTVQITLTHKDVSTALLQIFSAQPATNEQTTASWMLAASATICLQPTPPLRETLRPTTPEQVQQKWAYLASARNHYQELRRRGIEHGPLFQGITHIWQHHTEAMAQITIPELLAAELPLYQFHPAVLDICLQAVMSLLPEDTEESAYVPIAVEKVKMFQQPERERNLWSYATLRPNSNNQSDVLTGDILLVDESGQSILEVSGFCLQRLEGNTHQTMEDKLSRLLYTLYWEPVASIEHMQSRTARKRWLILSEKGGIGQALADMLQAHGASCVVVYPGPTYTYLDAQHYEIDPASPAMYQQLLADTFANTSQPCQGIVYLWGETHRSQATTLHSLQAEQQKGSIAALSLIQAIIGAKWESLPRLWFVTCGTQAVQEADQVISLAQSSLWGLGRVLVYEHPDLHSTLIDIDAACTPESLEALHKEIWSDDCANEIALRGTRRFVARLVHDTPQITPNLIPESVVCGENSRKHLKTLSTPCYTPTSGTPTDLLFRADATYLITGGLGGIGLKVAQWMVEQGAKHLVLLGRSGASTAAEKTVAQMQEAGSQVKIVKGDIAHTQLVANTLADIHQSMPPLRGIMHCAVVLEDSLLLQADQEQFLAVMRPKIDGAWNLHTLTLDQSLDFFVLFSSAASLIGSPGQGNYAAANAFMDALAHYRRSRGYAALSINWGSWSEIGQATLHNRSQRLDSRGFASMKPQEALLILGNLLRGKASQVGVMSFNMQKWTQFYPTLGTSSLFASLTQEGADVQEEQDYSRLTQKRLLSMQAEQRLQASGTYLSEQIAKVIGLSASKIDAHQQLSRLGIDSLMSVELKNRIASDLQVVVPVALFLQGMTLEQLTSHVLREIEGRESFSPTLV